MIPLIAACVAALMLIGVTVGTLHATRGKSRWVAILGVLVLVGTPLNIAVCMYVLNRHGGTPINPRDGVYFTISHGQLTEVTEETWHALETYLWATWVSSIVASLVWVCLFGGYIRRVQDREMEERLRGRRT
jgi:hypothetical protein